MSELIIGKCRVDFDRCSITKEGNTHSVEPKVMEVLECLWIKQNQVVSQQAIFDTVWPKAIFNPSSVQRSIAILRKIIEQDTKAPQFIITHPKRGYSLVLPQTTEVTSEQPARKIWPLLMVALFCLMAGGVWFTGQEQQIQFGQLRPMTSSESSEYSLVMSPTSDIAAFVRIGSPMKNHIWLKNLSNGVERQITPIPANYRKLGWARDGNAIAYVTRTDDKDQLNYISIDPNTLSAMEPVALAEFSASSIESFQMQWSSIGDIYFVQSTEDSTTLLRRYSIKQNTTTSLKTYQGKEQLLSIALSPDETQLALAFDVHQNKYTIALMALNTLEVLPLANLEGSIRGLNWHPNNQSLLISNHDKLRQVSLNQQVQVIDFDNFHYIRNAGYNYDGTEIVMELINLDVDILYSEQSAPYQYQTLVDTQSLDFLPIYAPQADKFAFESHRNGSKQLFVYEQGEQRLVFSNPKDQELFGLVWSADGKQIITASKDKLFIIDVQVSKYQEISHYNGPFYLREWYQHEDALLVSLVTDNGFKPAKFDLQTKQLSVLLDSVTNFECAYMSLDQHDQLYFSDNKHIYTLNNQGEHELVWQAKNGDITGFTLGQQSFSVGLAHQTGFELVKVSNNHSEPLPLFSTHFDQGLHLTSTSKNADKFLFSKVKEIKQLVRLK